MVYLLIFILIFFGVYRYDYCRQEKGKFVYLAIICMLFILVAGLRYRLGQDTLSYLMDYERLRPITNLGPRDFERTRFAPGFVIFTSIFKQFTSDFTYFQVFQAAFVNIILFYFFNKYTKHVFFAILIYFFYEYFIYSFQQMREAMAVCIFLLSWPFFLKGKWLWWYLASFLAFTFHISAIVMFVVPLICLPGIRQLFIFGKRTLIICFVLMVVFALIQSLFFKYIELLAVTDAMVERAQTYSKSDLGGTTLNIAGFISQLIRFIIYPLIALYFIKKRQDAGGGKVFNKFNAFVLMSIYISLVSFFISILLRYNNYFFPFATILLADWVFSYIPQGHRKIKFKFAYWVLIFLPMFGMQFYNYLGKINKSGTMKSYMVYYPYRTVFDKTENHDTERTLRYMHKHF